MPTRTAIVHNITINSANTSRDSRIKKEFDAEQIARTKDPTYKPSHAYTKVGDPELNTYIREERMAQGVDAIANTIVHEAVHLAGVVGSPNSPSNRLNRRRGSSRRRAAGALLRLRPRRPCPARLRQVRRGGPGSRWWT